MGRKGEGEFCCIFVASFILRDFGFNHNCFSKVSHMQWLSLSKQRMPRCIGLLAKLIMKFVAIS